MLDLVINELPNANSRARNGSSVLLEFLMFLGFMILNVDWKETGTTYIYICSSCRFERWKKMNGFLRNYLFLLIKTIKSNSLFSATVHFFNNTNVAASG